MEYLDYTFAGLISFIVKHFFSNQVVSIAQKMVALHIQYAPTIIQLAREAVTNGYPINRPLWWFDPTDPETFSIDSRNFNAEKHGLYCSFRREYMHFKILFIMFLKIH